MSMAGNGDRRARLVEMAISVGASVITSAVVVAWTISASLTSFRERIDSFDRQMRANGEQIASLNARDLAQVSQLSATDAHYQDILRRLDSIDRRLEPPR